MARAPLPSPTPKETSDNPEKEQSRQRAAAVLLRRLFCLHAKESVRNLPAKQDRCKKRPKRVVPATGLEPVSG